MFVTNHVLSGVVIGRWFERRPVTAFVVGVGSHLLLDMVPHWGCEKRTADGSDLFLKYAKRDGVIGMITMAGATWAVDRQARVATLAAMVGAALLDADKVCAYFLGVDPFPRVVRRIHSRAQNESPAGMLYEIAFGIACAALDVVTTSEAARSASRS
jgi:hypothetical protein